MRATSHAPPETSIATRSVHYKPAASASSPSAAISTRPAGAPPRPRRPRPRRNRGASQGRSRDRSTSAKAAPAARPITSLNESTKTGQAAGERHRPIRARGTIRASRRGGHRKARARSPSSKTACRPRSPKRPLSRITRPYARGRTEPPGPRFSCPEMRASASARFCLAPHSHSSRKARLSPDSRLLPPSGDGGRSQPRCRVGTHRIRVGAA
jgi:hypothetical protein